MARYGRTLVEACLRGLFGPDAGASSDYRFNPACFAGAVALGSHPAMTNLSPPNFYRFATKERFQDAALAYILAWADPKYRDAPDPDSGMHALGRALLNALVSSHPARKDWAPEKVTTVEVEAQEKHVDVCAEITTEDGKVFLIVEDKIHTSEHSDQIRRYVERAKSDYEETEIVPVYVKTGNESPNYHRISIPCGRVFRSDLLAVLNDHRETRNRIVDDFRTHWQEFEDWTQKWRAWPMARWKDGQIEGYYLALEGTPLGSQERWKWGVDTKGHEQVLNFWTDDTSIHGVQVRLEISNAAKMMIQAHQHGRDRLSRETLDHLKKVFATREGLSIGMGLTLQRARTKAGSWWPRPVQIHGLPKLDEDDIINFDETVKRICRVRDFIREIAQRVKRRANLNELVQERLETIASQSSWEVCRHTSFSESEPERLRLYKEDHWSNTAFSGVWFMWDGDSQALQVGIEWPKDRGTSLDERVRECFRRAGVEVSSPRRGGGRGLPKTRWFFGAPKAEDWSWEQLSDKSDEELRDYADTVAGLMRALAGVIDDAEETAAGQTAR